MTQLLTGLLAVLYFVPAQAGLMEFMSTAAYNLFPGGERCESVDEARAHEAMSAIALCRTTSVAPDMDRRTAPLADLAPHLTSARTSERAQDRFFGLLAQENRNELDCAADFARDIVGNEQGVRIIRERLRALGDAQRLVTEKAAILASPQHIGPRICPLSIDQLEPPNPHLIQLMGRDSGHEVCRDLIAARTAVKMIKDSLPLTGSPAVAELADQMNRRQPLSDSELDQRIRQTYQNAERSIRNDSQRINRILESRGGAGFNRSERYALMSDPVLVRKVLDLSPQPEALEPVACQANAAYGEGADRLQMTLIVGSLLFGGVTSIVARTGVAAAQVHIGLQAARTAGTLSFTSARAIQTAALFSLGVGTGLAEGLATAQAIESACLSGRRFQTRATNSCVAAPQVSQLESDNCVLAASLSAIGIGGTALGVRSASRSQSGVSEARAETEMARGSRLALRTAASREEFTAHYLRYEATTLSQNEEWVRRATAGPGTRTRFVEMENWQLRDLNTRLHDKDLVTALTNRHKEITMEEFAALSARYPGLRFHPYSDYKSVRFAIEGDPPAGFDADLQATFARIQTRYATDLRGRGLVRAEDNPADWFRAAMGGEADQASLAARWAREHGHPSRIASFADPAVRRGIETNLRETETLRQRAVTSLQGTSLIERSPEGHTVLSREVIEVLRRTNDDAEAARLLRQRYGLARLSTEQVGVIRSYVRSADRFSPSLHVIRRDVATLEDADLGGFSIDFVGMGATNLQATANSLAGVTSVDDAILRARAAEHEVTALFESRRTSVTEAARAVFGAERVRTVCSGDDCVGLLRSGLSSSERVRLANYLASQQDGSNVRLAFIPPGIPDRGARTVLATHGESLEKLLRANLVGEIEPTRLRGLLFAVDVRSTDPGTGSMHLITGRPPHLRLSPTEQRAIDRAFQRSLEQLNQELFSGAGGYR